jgi:4-hydroxy-tetrahydrodipicolinate synthase
MNGSEHETDMKKADIAGVIPAAVTPIHALGAPDPKALQRHLKTLAGEGCHGALILGTTGEGPSLGMAEREALLEAALEVEGRGAILVGTGTPSLTDTIALTQKAYQLGAQAAVVVPPYYYRSATIAGLLDYFRHILDDAVPDGKTLLLYHIPQVTGVPISFDLLEALLAACGGRTLGIKDSSGDLDHAQSLCRRFPELHVFVGTDRLLLAGLEAGAKGCITAGANVLAPLAVRTYRAHAGGQTDDARRFQAQLTQARAVLERYQPFAASLKALLSVRYGGSSWTPRAPLLPLAKNERAQLVQELGELKLEDDLHWIEG